METALGMLIALGVFVGGPAIIGFGILGTVILRERRMARARELQAAGAAQAERHVTAGGRKAR